MLYTINNYYFKHAARRHNVYLQTMEVSVTRNKIEISEASPMEDVTFGESMQLTFSVRYQDIQGEISGRQAVNF